MKVCKQVKDHVLPEAPIYNIVKFLGNISLQILNIDLSSSVLVFQWDICTFLNQTLELVLINKDFFHIHEINYLYYQVKTNENAQSTLVACFDFAAIFCDTSILKIQIWIDRITFISVLMIDASL